MDDTARQANDFSDAKQRLEQIADKVNDESLSLDEALDLFEEAVSLGMQVSDLLETGLEDALEADAANEAAERYDDVLAD